MPAKQERRRNNIICVCVLNICIYVEHLNVLSTQGSNPSYFWHFLERDVMMGETRLLD